MQKAKRFIAAALSLLLSLTLLPFSSATAADLSNEYRLSISGEYIYNLPENTTVASLMASVYSTAVLKTADGIAVDKNSTELVCTGMKLVYTNAEYTIVVSGDINEDGLTSSVDYISLCKVVKGGVVLGDAAKNAADIDGDGAVTTADLLNVKGYVKGNVPLYKDSYLTEEEKQAAVVVDPTVTDSSEDSSEGGDTSDDPAVGDNSGEATIVFNGSTVTVTGTGAEAVGNYAYVTKGGNYTVKGSTTNGYVHVAAGLEDKVSLTLSGVSITNTEGPALYFEQCKKANIVLSDGSTSTLADGATTTLLDKGAVFANDTISISGAGTLYVTGNRQHGIASDDDIVIKDAKVVVSSAVKDALHANDDITVESGSLTVSTCGSDAIESEGTVSVNGGTLTLSASAGSAIKAGTVYTGNAGNVTVLTSADGIKSAADINIIGGTYQITTTDNAVKATGTTTVSGGTINVTASDTGIKGDTKVNITGGTMTLNSSNNAIKSDLDVSISGGDITINSTGDGVKANSLDPNTTAGETRTTYTYGSLNGSVSTSGCYVWTTGTVSNTAVYWFLAIAKDNGAGGYTVTQTVATGTAKNFTLSTGEIALLTHQDQTNYAATCLIQVGDTVTYNTSTKQVTVTTAGNYLGDVNITGGNMYIKCSNDAIDAGSNVNIDNSTTAKTSSSGISSGSYNLYIVAAGGASASVDTTAGSYKAIKADDSVVINNVKLYSSSPEDTIKSDDYVEITGGNFTIYSGRDGISSSGTLNISGGTIYVKTANGYAGTVSSTSESYKAIKGTGEIVISGGSFDLNSYDDAIHSNGAVTITGGTYSIYTGDDAVHSDTTTTISGGDMTVHSSYEGVEGLNVNITGGKVRITASDDGINAAGGSDGSGNTNPGRPGMPGGSMGGDTSKYSLNIGGTAFVWISNSGDGVDSNGSLTVSGGTLIVQQSGGGNSGLDADGTRLINGGLVIIVDGGDMVELPSTSSSQYVFSTSVSGSANSILAVKDSSGNTLFAFKPNKSYKHIMISTPDLKSGATYSIYTGGSCTGTLTDGLYSGGTYSGGSLYKSITLSSKVTSK